MNSLKLQPVQEERSSQPQTIDIIRENADIWRRENLKGDIQLRPQRYRGICVQCGQPRKGTGKLCRACYDKNRTVKIDLTCSRCGKEYQVLKYQHEKAVKNGYVESYCSKECSCRANAEKQKSVRCPICGEFVPRGRKYCSDACKKIGLRNRRDLGNLICPVCGTDFRPRSHRTMYCSMECKNKAHSQKMQGSGNSHYKDGLSYLKEFDDIKPFIKKRDNYACQICGEKEKMVPNKRYGVITNLRIHHKDEDITNNTEENLTTLCQECHIRLHKTKK